MLIVVKSAVLFASSMFATTELMTIGSPDVVGRCATADPVMSDAPATIAAIRRPGTTDRSSQGFEKWTIRFLPSECNNSRK
jgi:hypothetical protein